MITENENLIESIIKQALAEDLGESGDVTSLAIFSTEDQASAIIKSKASGILSGAYLIPKIFNILNPSVQCDIKVKDGDVLEKGTVICKLQGPVHAILGGERITLNFLQRLSGIATSTSKLVKAISHTSTRLLDTRKTTPNLRILEKKAVVHGGGYNHRFGLFDMILIKDTHVKRSGGVGNALSEAIKFRGNNTDLKIEVEIQSLEEFLEALSFMPDRIMLDNMNTVDMTRCVHLVRTQHKPIELEASGNITLETIRSVAETGVDFISSGTITHSAPALDIHLLIT
ncbi:MAG: carboxylating nicotinate-nucleotide diphosphorylase [Fibrobacter sp.]|nr:carboxylating nicotinate-nucleotide diphosphorylase [Fibrobacter sp.]